MRRTAVAAILVACAATVAAPAFGKGKPNETGPGCRPQVMVVLKGTLAASPSATATSILVTLTKANHHGAGYLKLGQPLLILVNADTKVRRQGQKMLADLKQNDPVMVHARACKADLKSGTPTLTANMIVAHDPTKAGHGNDQQGEDNDDND